MITVKRLGFKFREVSMNERSVDNMLLDFAKPAKTSRPLKPGIIGPYFRCEWDDISP